MINFGDYANENKTKQFKVTVYSRSSIQNIIIGGWGFGKTNAILSLINNQPDIDKIYLYTKDP